MVRISGALANEVKNNIIIKDERRISSLAQ
jgi:hypothetical protein